MAIKKYINTREVAELTGQPYEEIVRLARTGVLPSHKTRRGHYRLNVEAVEKFFGIQINKSEEKDDKPKKQVQNLPQTRLITENFYQEVIERVRGAKSSARIMTADFNLVRLKPTASQGKKWTDGTPLMELLMRKSKQGLLVEIISSEDSTWFQEDVERANCGEAGNRFNVWLCARNHAKVVIIDDKFAYIGSANMTKAGLGQPQNSPGNFEVGILTEDPEMIASLNDQFARITSYEFCEGCHRRKNCIEDKS